MLQFSWRLKKLCTQIENKRSAD